MIFDGHIHLLERGYSREVFLSRLSEAGIGGGIVFSLPPETYGTNQFSVPPEERMEIAVELCEGAETLYPFFWIDPLESDAEKQVDRAIHAGMKGFKVICDSYYPDNEKALKVFSAIAERGCPLMFHSGILWDGTASSKYNHPVNFEILLAVKKLRFSLAHVSWPWTDEMIAVYGKFQTAYRQNPELSSELFIDTTPGTPAVYREDVLRKIYSTGYDVENNIFFGTDNSVRNYEVTWATEWIERDKRILESPDFPEEISGRYFSENVLRFING